MFKKSKKPVKKLTESQMVAIAAMYKKSYRDIQKIIWNNPATIVILKSGEKGISKVQEGDSWSLELGFWVAYAKALQKKKQPINYFVAEDVTISFGQSND